jgi:hypothetical protein
LVNNINGFVSITRSGEKWLESSDLQILSPVRLPFRHTGNSVENANHETPEKEARTCIRILNRKGHKERRILRVGKTATNAWSSRMASWWLEDQGDSRYVDRFQRSIR